MIKFFNIKSKVEMEVSNDGQLTALIGLSDMGVNGKLTDQGWRLSPETKAEIDNRAENMEILNKIAQKKGCSVAEVAELDILFDYVYELTALQSQKSQVAARNEFSKQEDDYEKEVEKAKKAKVAPVAPVAPTTDKTDNSAK